MFLEVIYLLKYKEISFMLLSNLASLGMQNLNECFRKCMFCRVSLHKRIAIEMHKNVHIISLLVECSVYLKSG
jgi:hypothetical protein